MVAKRSLRLALREARSVVWLFHSSDERQCRPPAKALPAWVSRHWPVCFVTRLGNDHRHCTRRAPHTPGQWKQKRDSWILLRPLLSYWYPDRAPAVYVDGLTDKYVTRPKRIALIAGKLCAIGASLICRRLHSRRRIYRGRIWCVLERHRQRVIFGQLWQILGFRFRARTDETARSGDCR